MDHGVEMCGLLSLLWGFVAQVWLGLIDGPRVLGMCREGRKVGWKFMVFLRELFRVCGAWEFSAFEV